jgi:hypothetical protein
MQKRTRKPTLDICQYLIMYIKEFLIEYLSLSFLFCFFFVVVACKALKENGSNGYLVGKRLSLADISLLEGILSVEELLGHQELEPYPEIQVKYDF